MIKNRILFKNKNYILIHFFSYFVIITDIINFLKQVKCMQPNNLNKTTHFYVINGYFGLNTSKLFDKCIQIDLFNNL